MIVNQIYGCGESKSAPVSHSFIELYNPTDTAINLDGWSVQYRSSEDGRHDKSWVKLDLEGTVNPRTSFLIRCNASASVESNLVIDQYDMQWEQIIHNKGISVVLLASTALLDSSTVVFDADRHAPTVSGYVDMLSVSGINSVASPEQAVVCYEGDVLASQTKNTSVRRILFSDTDDNKADSESINYSTVSAWEDVRPHSSADGEWGLFSDQAIHDSLISRIEYQKQIIPKYYQKYCTQTSVNALTELLDKSDDSTLTGLSNKELTDLYHLLTNAVTQLSYHSDSVFPQIYITTDNGSGESYGKKLSKSTGYVSSRVAVVNPGGELAVDDMEARIKIRGSSTAVAEKKPYTIHFKRKQDLFGLGKATEWVLLADCFDPTLMRNEMGLDLAEKLGLSATPGHKKVEVWVDGAYNGLYLLTEKIEVGKSRVDIDYQKGDFLIEMTTPYRRKKDELYITTTEQGRLFKVRSADKDSTDNMLGNITNSMDAFETALSSGDFARIRSLIDVESFASYYLVNEYMKTIDFYCYSVYFYSKNGVL